MAFSVLVSYLCDHGKAQDEEAGAADQGEERFVLPQVFGELVRHRRNDGLNGGKLGWKGGEKCKKIGDRMRDATDFTKKHR